MRRIESGFTVLEVIVVVTILTAEGDLPELEEHEDVRVGELVLEREPHDIEVSKRPRVFEGAKRLVVRPQLLLHVGPHRVCSLREEVGALIDDIVQNLVAEVAHPDFIQVGKRQADPAGDGVPRFASLALLAAQILCRLVHTVDERRVGVFSHVAWLGHGASLEPGSSAARGADLVA